MLGPDRRHVGQRAVPAGWLRARNNDTAADAAPTPLHNLPMRTYHCAAATAPPRLTTRARDPPLGSRNRLPYIYKILGPPAAQPPRLGPPPVRKPPMPQKPGAAGASPPAGPRACRPCDSERTPPVRALGAAPAAACCCPAAALGPRSREGAAARRRRGGLECRSEATCDRRDAWMACAPTSTGCFQQGVFWPRFVAPRCPIDLDKCRAARARRPRGGAAPGEHCRGPPSPGALLQALLAPPRAAAGGPRLLQPAMLGGRPPRAARGARRACRQQYMSRTLPPRAGRACNLLRTAVGSDF